MRRVVVTGLGAITPLAVGLPATWSRLIAGHSGILSLATSHPPASQWTGLSNHVAGLVPTADNNIPPLQDDISIKWNPSDWLSPTQQRSTSQFAQYAIAASTMALTHANWAPTAQHSLESTGVCLGSGIGNLADIHDTALLYHQKGPRKVSPLFVPRILINIAAGHVAMKFGFRGPNHAASTACTTGAHSVGDAARFISFGDADVMVAGGAESCIHPLTFAGFGKARSLAAMSSGDDEPAGMCRPFDEGRTGFVVSEGAATLVLEEMEHAMARGATILAEVKGYGCSGDAHHVTAPRADGSGALLAMKKALKNAGVKPREVDYINAHATGTVIGDVAEASAIKQLMLGEDGVERLSQITVSSTKGALGHLLGAAGAIEAALCVLAIGEGVVPPTLNLDRPDAEVKGLNCVAHVAQEKKVRAAMSNSFGFGGTNSSLVLTKFEK